MKWSIDRTAVHMQSFIAKPNLRQMEKLLPVTRLQFIRLFNLDETAIIFFDLTVSLMAFLNFRVKLFIYQFTYLPSSPKSIKIIQFSSNSFGFFFKKALNHASMKTHIILNMEDLQKVLFHFD